MDKVPVSFENTQVAFESKSERDLHRAFLLFQLLEKKTLVDAGKHLTQIAFNLKLPIRPFIKATLFKQFVGGETIEECEPTIAALWKYKIGTILDYSVEGKKTAEGFEATTQEILSIIDFAGQDERIPFCVFKLTGLAPVSLLEKRSQGQSLSDEEIIRWQDLIDRVDVICKSAVASQTLTLIDAEESWLQAAIDEIATDMMKKYNQDKVWVYNTLQMYRHDRLDYLKDQYQQAQNAGYKLGFKLVRGAYMEKERARAKHKGYPDPIHPTKAATDQAFDEAVLFCLDHIENIGLCAGSHNQASNELLTQEMEKRQIPPEHEHIWFAQLLGMSDNLSYNLAKSGYHVAKYVPYAPLQEIVPYLIRRAEENTSVAGQSSRELELIKKELERRRTHKTTGQSET